MPPGLYYGKSFLVEAQNSKHTFIYLHDRPLGYSAIRGHREEIHVVIKVIFLPFYLEQNSDRRFKESSGKSDASELLQVKIVFLILR